MQIPNIQNFPKELKALISAFLIVLSIGFFTGLLFVENTSADTPQGMEEQYLGNESNEDAEIMKFKKSEKEMLNIVHTHVLSMSMIFFFVGLLLLTTSINHKLKMFLAIEPFVSVILTFGGLFLLWKGYTFMKYIVMISGILMTGSYILSVFFIFKDLLRKRSIED